MPKTKAQRFLFALLTVVVTVHAYVFYSLYVINGSALMAANQASSVLVAIRAQGGVSLLGHMAPIWAIVLVEFVLALSMEVLVGSPCSFRLAAKCFAPAATHPVLMETAVISATVGIMCPLMSFLAAWLYYPYYMGFHLATLLANWLKLVCLNFPFGLFTQLFFIQPLVRKVFGLMTRRPGKLAAST